MNKNITIIKFLIIIAIGLSGYIAYYSIININFVPSKNKALYHNNRDKVKNENNIYSVKEKALKSLDMAYKAKLFNRKNYVRVFIITFLITIILLLILLFVFRLR